MVSFSVSGALFASCVGQEGLLEFLLGLFPCYIDGEDVESCLAWIARIWWKEIENALDV
jgi:hypothetical protein